MELTRAWRRALAAVRCVVTVVAALACIATITAPAFAGTTGVVKGTVTEDTGAPLAGVAVTLKSPSGTYHATTDSHGFYTIIGVYTDTYTASFDKSGYGPKSITGVVVFADQTITVNQTLTKALKEIAKVTARSTSSAYQPEQTVDTYTVNATQIEQMQGTDFNLSESNLITALPGAEYDSSGYPVIHGGRENEEGFEFEGIPYTDAYTNQFVNTLALPGSGIASAQLTPGVGDASIQSNGTGVLNLVAQRGTYPGFTQLEASAGGGQFYHAFNGAMSYASANGHISDYAAFAGAQTGFFYGNGQYTSNQLGIQGNLLLEADREFMNNLIFRFGKNNNQTLQLFADVAQHNFFLGYGGKTQCFESCNPFLADLTNLYYGLTPTQTANLSGLYPEQTSVDETLAQANRAPGTYWQPNESYKVEYDWNINPSTYLKANVYSVNSVTTFDFPAGGANFYGDGDTYLFQGGHSLGSTFAVEKQLNEKNLLSFGYDYAWRHPEDNYDSIDYGWLSYLFYNYTVPYAFVSPTDPNCPSEAAFSYPCGAAYAAYSTPPSQLTLTPFDQGATINRRDQSYYLEDKIAFSDRVNADLGIREEMFDYVGFSTPELLSNCTFLYNAATITINNNYNPNDPSIAPNCPYIPTFNVTSQMTNPRELEPRLGLSWQIGRDSALRFTYQRATAAPIIALVNFVVPPIFDQYDKIAPTPFASCGQYLWPVSCNNLAEEMYWAQQNFDGIPNEPVLPMTSNNYQITLQHQFTKGALNGVAVSIAPWTRHQYNTEASLSQPLIIDGKTIVQNGEVVLGPSLATNLGKEFATGVDLNVTRESPRGISFQWTATYINEFSSVLPTSGSEDFFPSIPYSSAVAGNIYRVGFLSPFQTTLGLTYRTPTGWRINPRVSYNIGYPIGVGTLTADLINGVAYNIPNTNELPGGAASSEGIGPNYYVDPLDPGSALNPNIAAERGTQETSSPGGKLSPPNLFAGITLEYSPPAARYKVGFDVENIFNRIYSGAYINGGCQIVATGLCGPLSGYSTLATAYDVPYATPVGLNQFGNSSVFANYPTSTGRIYYVYYSVKI
jgi:Carboxypeptidase regulatory-like domain